MVRRLSVLLVAALVMAALLAGCGDSSVKTDAANQIKQAKKALSDAEAKGVKIPDDVKKMLENAEGKQDSDSVNALILATTALADIENDVEDAFNMAEQTYNVAKGAADAAIGRAPQGADLASAKQSLANAEDRKNAARTIEDWYDPKDGPIYWANLAGQQAGAAAAAAAAAQGEEQAIAEMQKRIEQGSSQMLSLMNNYLVTKGFNPADFKLGITKISASSIDWATGAATPLAPMPGSKEMSFLFQYENGNWVLRAAPSWTKGQFGAPADMLP